MIPLIRHYLKAFFFDQNAAKRFLVGLGALIANIVLAIMVFGFTNIIAWDQKTFLQHLTFALASTLTTMLPGPAIAKPPPAAPAPDRGYVNSRWVIAGVSGVVQALLMGLALHTVGADHHAWSILCIGAGYGQGWLVLKALK